MRGRIGGVTAVALVTFACTSTAGAALDPIAVKNSSAINEYAPAADGQWFAWTESSPAYPNRTNLFIQRNGGPRKRVNNRRSWARGGGIDGDLLVYSSGRHGWPGDIHRWHLPTNHHQNISAKVSTRWDEYHPTVSRPWVLFTRYIWTKQITRVLLYNMQTRAIRVLGSDRGRYRFVYSGQVNGDYATWGRVRPGGQDIYRYRISTRTNELVPRLVFAQYNPFVASDGTMYYARSGRECGDAVTLVRRAPDGTTVALYGVPAGMDLGYGFADEQADGSLDAYFGRVSCRSGRWNIYKVIDSHTLAVSKDGLGGGSVTSTPLGINCGAACSYIFRGGTVVTLSAAADPGSLFAGWSEPSCGTAATCQVTVEDEVSITATFDLAP